MTEGLSATALLLTVGGSVAKISKLSASVKYTALYTCTRCGCEREGVTASLDVAQVTVDQLVELLSRQKQSPYNMPVGWVSRLHGIYCAVCARGM